MLAAGIAARLAFPLAVLAVILAAVLVAAPCPSLVAILDAVPSLAAALAASPVPPLAAVQMTPFQMLIAHPAEWVEYGIL